MSSWKCSLVYSDPGKKNAVTLLLLLIGFLLPLSDVNLTFDLIQQAEIGALHANTEIARVSGWLAEREALQKLVDEISKNEYVSVAVDEYRSVTVDDLVYAFPVEQIDTKWAHFRKKNPDFITPAEGESPYFYTPSFYFNPAYQPQNGDRIRIGDTEYQYGGKIYNLGRNLSLIIERPAPFMLEKNDMGTHLFFTYEQSHSKKVRAMIEQYTKGCDVRLSYTNGEERQREVVINAYYGTFAMLKLSVFIWIAAFLNLGILLFARFKEERYQLAVQAALGERPLRMWKNLFLQTGILFIATIPGFLLLFPVYTKISHVLPDMNLHWQTFAIYGLVGILLSLVYSGLGVMAIFRKSLAAQLRRL